VTGTGRQLLVVRHAKSDWSAPAADIDRPLNRRGRRDAPAIGRWIASRQLPVDAAVISPAARTRATWRLLADAADLDVDPGLDRGIYLGEAADLAEAVRTIDQRARCGVLVGHAPGCEEFVEWLAEERGDADAFAAMRAKYPTAAVALLGIDGPWASLGPGAGELLAFAVCRG
jgi:phosphohistidine phosphatase